MFYIRNLFLTISFLCSALITLGDSMGSITSLTRNGRQDGGTYGKVNQLTYGYDGNRLVSVSDAVTSPTYNGFFGFCDGADQAVEYEYDANGNMTRDRNKGISSIQYNADNLPLCIQYDNGSRATYLYSADGTKLQVRYETSYAGLLSSGPPSGSASTDIAQTHTIDYVGNKIYEDGTLKKILVDGGYVEYNGGSPVYHAYLTDHQDNVRVVVDENATAKQVNHYYPYGGLMAESTGGDVQRYKYNGKELDRMHGLDWYDYGARHNDAAIGRWHSMDPLCEKYYDVSPYAYCGNDPLNNIDPDGRMYDWYKDKDNTYQYSPYVHSQKDLSKGQIYIGKSFTEGKGNNLVQYRADGSILYNNETAAYNRMWNQADVHYRQMGEKGGREVGGFILSDGKVLVLPDYKNDANTSEISEYRYQINKNGIVAKGNEKFSVLANIHTHQNSTGDPTPSFYPTSKSDLGVSINMGGRPVLTMGHDNMVYGIYYNKQNQGSHFTVNHRTALLRGEYTIYPWLKQTKFR